MKRLHIIFSIILVLFLAAPYCYADSMNMESGQISMDVPAGWNVITTEQFSQEAGTFFDITEKQSIDYLQTAGKVFLGEKTFKRGDKSHKSSMEINYNPYTNDMESYDEYAEEDLKAIYETEGTTIISEALNNDDDFETSGDPKIINGTWGPYVQIDLMNQDTKYGKANCRLYYTVKEGVLVSFIFSSYEGSPQADEIKDAEAMVKSYEDTGYYYDYTGIDDEVDDTYYDDGDNWITIMIPIIIAVIAGTLGLLKKSGDTGRTANTSSQPKMQKQQVVVNQQQERPVMAEEKTPKRIIPKIQPIKADGKTVAMRSASGPRKAKSSEESYEASLKTLLDSGLLTKDEYRDMLDKHNRRR